jgi:hypothetical protein
MRVIIADTDLQHGNTKNKYLLLENRVGKMKCEICGEEAGYRLSPDLDINGLGACEKHVRDMQVAYFILFQEGEEEFNEFIKNLKSNYVIPPSSDGSPPPPVGG